MFSFPAIFSHAAAMHSLGGIGSLRSLTPHVGLNVVIVNGAINQIVRIISVGDIFACARVVVAKNQCGIMIEVNLLITK